MTGKLNSKNRLGSPAKKFGYRLGESAGRVPPAPEKKPHITKKPDPGNRP